MDWASYVVYRRLNCRNHSRPESLKRARHSGASLHADDWDALERA
jgi:hypothetical protein